MLTEKSVSVLPSFSILFAKRKTIDFLKFCVYIISSEVMEGCISKEICFSESSFNIGKRTL